MTELIGWLVVVALCIWVFVDSSNLGARRGTVGGGMLDMGPVGWFFSCLLIPIVGLICYLCARPRLVMRHQALTSLGWTTGGPAYGAQQYYHHPAGPAYLPPAPPPGWYAEPSSATGRRWWDGTAWTPYV